MYLLFCASFFISIKKERKKNGREITIRIMQRKNTYFLPMTLKWFNSIFRVYGNYILKNALVVNLSSPLKE